MTCLFDVPQKSPNSNMKYIIWNYREGNYISGPDGNAIQFSTEHEAERYVKAKALTDVENGIEQSLEEAIENGYLVEDFVTATCYQ